MGNNTGNITLAIETAVTGGSLALLKDGREIDLWLGGEGVSRSEDLLVSISDILAKNAIERMDLTSIAVSTGPGSYTGTRVGISTALGLKNALGVPCVGFQVLEAMAAAFEAHSGQIIAAIPVGRDEVCWQSFDPDGGELLVNRESRFVEYLVAGKPITAVLHGKLFELLAANYGVDISSIKDAGYGLARYIGIAAHGSNLGRGLLPTYVRDFL